MIRSHGLIGRFLFHSIGGAVLTVGLFCTSPARAQTHADIVAAASSSCAVMSGERKADSRTLQYLLLMDEDMGEANPVAFGVYHEVLKQCPKAYLAYEQRKRSSNPFPPGSLTSGTTTQLTGGSTALTTSGAPKDYALRCRGASGMATYDGPSVAIVFAHASEMASPSLRSGRCAWLDRAFRPRESSRIVVKLPSTAVARRVALDVNAGQTWTFWVFGEGPNLRADSLAQGTPAHKK